MSSPASLLAQRLSLHAEAVCTHYLSNGRKHGRFWLVGDVFNTPGRSLFVRLVGPSFGKGAAGKWTDAATGEHGDLVDLIRLNRGFIHLREALDEARIFLSEPARLTPPARVPVPRNSPAAARRLFAASHPVISTLAETYLRGRGISCSLDLPALRFHPACYQRASDDASRTSWPALITAVTDLGGTITGVHRTWLAPDGRGKAPIEDPRRALGDILGSAVRFGVASDVLAAGEGIETMLALRSVLPTMPMVAALSANHLALILWPDQLRRLYIAVDNDPAGHAAAARLVARAHVTQVEARLLRPHGDDWNSDLMTFGADQVLAAVITQLAAEDAMRFARPFALHGLAPP
jgi:hypothetical protein